jgi:CubicO group peptidase (beta-lactamase class C family)
MFFQTPRTERVLIGLAVCFILIALFVAAPAPADERSSEELEKLEDYISAFMEANKVPGLSIALSKGNLYWEKGFGCSDLENKVPAKPETAYRLASVSKSMTALAVMKLYVDGKLDLNAEVQNYVPYFPKKKWPVLIRQVLGHLGGVSHYRNYEEEGSFTEHYDSERAIGVFADWELIAEPGTEYNYSSYGFNLLAAAVEGASGRPFGEYMRENVWGPLGMADTRLDDPYDLIPNRARGYGLVNGEVKNSRFVDISSRFGAGGLRSTAPDLIRYVKGLYAGKVILVEAVQEMWSSMATSDGRFTDYGMGWGTSPWSGYWVISHSGGQPETSTYLFFIPWDDFAVAVCCNREGAPVNEIAREAASLFLGACPMAAETSTKIDAEIYDGLQDAWSHGLGWFDRYGEPMTADPAELASAFDYLNETLCFEVFEGDFDAAKRRVDDGVQPVAGEPLTKAGAYMAAKLGESYCADKLRSYRSEGALPFLRDYVELCRRGEIPEQYRFNAELEERVVRWAASWEKTWTEEVRTFAARYNSQLEGAAQRLKEIFDGAEVYPRFNDRLNSYAYYLKANDRLDDGLAILQIAAELYPTDTNLFDSLGEFHLAKGDVAKAQEQYTKALEIDPGFASSQMALARINAVELSSEAMDALVGVYELEIGLKVKVFREETKLYAQPEGEDRTELVPQSETIFYGRDDDGVFQVTFVKDDSGRAAEVAVKMRDREMRGKRAE